MFFRNRKLPSIERIDLSSFENKLINAVADILPNNYRVKLRGQCAYLKLQRRIEYKRDLVIELYPESIDAIPNDLLFERTQEFILARLKYEVDGKTCRAKIKMVMGAIFELSISPCPASDISRLVNDPKFFLEVFEIESNLSSNIMY